MKKKSLVALSSLIGVGLTGAGLFAARAKSQADNLLETLSPTQPNDKNLLLIRNSIVRQQECLKQIELILARIHDTSSAEQSAKELHKLVSACENANFTMHYELIYVQGSDRDEIEGSYQQQVDPIKNRVNERVRALFGAQQCYDCRALGKAVFPLLT